MIINNQTKSEGRMLTFPQCLTNGQMIQRVNDTISINGEDILVNCMECGAIKAQNANKMDPVLAAPLAIGKGLLVGFKDSIVGLLAGTVDGMIGGGIWGAISGFSFPETIFGEGIGTLLSIPCGIGGALIGGTAGGITAGVVCFAGGLYNGYLEGKKTYKDLIGEINN